MKQLKLNKWILWCLLVPLLAACSGEDDIDGIFTNKVWRLTTIMQNKKPVYNYGSTEQNTISESAQNCFTISFLPTGNFNVQTLTNSYNGTWEADGKKHTITFTFKGSSSEPTDIVSLKMIQIMKNATKYTGDSQTLTINQQSGPYLLLSPLN